MRQLGKAAGSRRKNTHLSFWAAWFGGVGSLVCLVVGSPARGRGVGNR